MDKVVKVIEESFLAPLLKVSDVSDVSYNGQALYYFSAVSGRQLFGHINPEEVAQFLRNIANYANERFSYSETFLDISVDKYRLSAMHYAVSRFGYAPRFSFALRINHDFLKHHPAYLGNEVELILKAIMQTKKSIIISGSTGVGKTTLQKHLVTLLPANTRVLVIDNVLELGEVHDLNPNLDLTLWQTKTNSVAEIKDYVQKALRFHPDYLIIAETRGSEMSEILQGSVSGHPNIVTLHAESAELVYERVSYLINSREMSAIRNAYPYVIHLVKRKTSEGHIERYIQKITAWHDESFHILYEKEVK